MTFAAIETAINTATVAALANATLTWGASSSADGVFREPSQALLGNLVDGSAPTFTARTSLIGAIAYGTGVTTRATNYTVVGNTPDGAGMTTLALQLAS